MDVELEEVEERVGYKVNGAVDVALDAEGEFEGTACFITGWEGDVLELAAGIDNVFTCVYCSIETRYWDWLARIIPSCFLRALQWLLAAQGT